MKGETPEAALHRELMEEFQIEVRLVERLLEHTETGGEYRGTYHVFVVDLVTPIPQVQCHEGIGIGFFRPQVTLTFRQHPVATRAIEHYLARYAGA